MTEKKLKCPSCGRETTEKEILEECSQGYMPYCYCQYSAIDPNTGDIWYPREFVEYVEVD